MKSDNIEYISQEELDRRLFDEGRFGVLQVMMSSNSETGPFIEVFNISYPGVVSFIDFWGTEPVKNLIDGVQKDLTDIERKAISIFSVLSHITGTNQQIFQVQFNCGPGPEGMNGPCFWDYFVYGPGVVYPPIKDVGVKIGTAILKPLIDAFDEYMLLKKGGA